MNPEYQITQFEKHIIEAVHTSIDVMISRKVDDNEFELCERCILIFIDYARRKNKKQTVKNEN
jgi:hypothetical protein